MPYFSSNGEVIHKATVPDTITSWITSAFAVHDEAGLGVAPETAKLEVFRPFFIRLNLPYAVKRGEKLALQVLIFNYMPKEQTVTVTLSHDADTGFDFVDRSGNPIKSDSGRDFNVRKTTVPGNGGSAAVYFPIIPSKVGDVKLLVKAIGDQGADAVEQPLLVEAEGFPLFFNQPLVVDLSKDTSFKKSVKLDFRSDAVEGSRRAEVSVVGDIMGPVLNNIENLVRMPYGCGEQNMLGFVPNIVVMRYLKATNRLTPTIEGKAKKYMEAGYQRELGYKRNDHSYSAFGQSDPQGSTWLTAFVVRSFSQAAPYIFIDGDIQAQSIKFLRQRQKENGAFEERGEVHHKDMQGGASEGGIPLTAYVLVAILESKQKSPEAVNFLERSLGQIANDPYALAVTTYALHLADSQKKGEALAALEKLASQKEGLKFWTKKPTTEPKKDQPWWYGGPPPQDVEMTSYALLTYMLRKETEKGLPLVRWLASQRNEAGGFASTQDTVVGLQALGAYAEAAYSSNIDMSFTVKNGEMKRSFTVKPDNSVVLQQFKMDNLEQPVEIEATGKGVAFAQISWRYNLATLKDAEPFACDQSVNQASDTDVLLALCCQYKKTGKSNMAVAEIDSLSGFTIDADQLNKLTGIPDIQRVELTKGDTKANLYFNSLSSNKICFNVSSQKSFSVGDLKPATVRLYDYYLPQDEIKFDYTSKKKRSVMDVCESDQEACWPSNAGLPPVAATRSQGTAAVSSAVSIVLFLLSRLVLMLV